MKKRFFNCNGSEGRTGKYQSEFSLEGEGCGLSAIVGIAVFRIFT